MSRQLIISLLVSFGLLAFTCDGNAASVPESKEPIKIALNEWTGQNVTAKVLGGIYESMGYKVEYVTAGAMPQFTAMQEGKLTTQPEVWTNLVGEAYPKALETKTIVELGLLGLNNYEGWAYPKYMEQMCPGLPRLEGLIACKDKLATPETFPKGRILAYPSDWGTASAKLVAGMKLPFVAVPAGSEGAEIAEIKAAFLKKAPLVLMFWKPHWVHAVYDMDWVQIDPPYSDACATDPKVGPNPDTTDDCGFPQARVVKSAWVGMEKQWPAAFSVLKNFQFDGTEQGKLVYEIDQKGRKLDDVVAEWLKSHEGTWKPWVTTATASN
ncbi:ABC transporter substrate-binding protein [Hyphomicrobium facile]|uniref:Glycine betaine/proline transport system substrate-binding protein n=1 Tax=Hyphomicrobium facile TaxID=51670 RepID=A0A1I7NE87_9HYPH|nr:ABC transporter substrate-binding protein [Hyphomicrobium facile]SFV32856.1 glycine betaine/proline transport system substrate-binding protein [Hyphomicrobium facile]